MNGTGYWRIAVWAALASALAMAQTPTATIVGTVQDPSGLPVPAASVDIRNTKTGVHRNALSGAQGAFTVTNLPPGVFEVVIRKEGFQQLRQSGIELQVDQVARLELELQVGSIAQSVDVEAQLPVINTENASRGEVITNLEITQMPLPGRSFADLAYLVPGVAEAGDGRGGFAVNGARADNTSLILDGVSARSTGTGALLISANLESVQEFRMITNNYSAEYGQFSGGVMNLALKSGTNRLHGSAFWFARDSTFEARNFFAAKKGDLRRHQFGGALNGPVVIPKLYNGRDRTFFLFSWESLRQQSPNNNLITVPTAAMKRGDFSGVLTAAGRPVVLRDPFAANAVYPNAVLPAALLHPTAAKLAAYWPDPNRPGTFNNYGLTVNQITNMDGITMKFDQNITAADRFSARVAHTNTWNDGTLALARAPAFTSNRRTPQPVAGINYTRTLTPAMVLDLRVGVARIRENYNTAFQGRNIPSELGIPGLTVAPHRVTFPQISVTGMSGIGDVATTPGTWLVSTTYQYAGVLSWSRGRHTVKTGGESQIGQWYRNGNGVYNGQFNFVGRWTNEGYGDFALGLLDSTRRNQRESHTYAYNRFYTAFLQDDVRVTSRLTMNLGLRWELPLPTQEKRGRWASFVPELKQNIISSDETLPNLAAELAVAGLTGKVALARDAGLPRSLVYTNYRNFAPRIGLAWRPFGGNRTVLRIGYGIFFGGNYLSPVAELFGGTYPFAILQQFVRVTTDPAALTLSEPFPEGRASIVGATATQGYDVRAKTPYLQSYNFTVERDLGRAVALEVAYSGSKGTHQGRGYNLNQPYYYQRELWEGSTPPVPYPGWGGINYFSFGSSSTFHSGQISLRKRNARGVFYRVNYVFGKSIDDSSTYWHATVGGYVGAQDSRNLRLERGRSDFDNRHAFTFNFSYRVPWRAWYARGWQVAGTGRAQSGGPFTPRTSLANLVLGESPRPDRASTGRIENPSPNLWFDRGAFPLVAAGSFRPGNSGRNILDGPGLIALNSMVSRNFKVREGGMLQFRWEVFNVPNHPNLLTPNTNVNDRDGATITRAREGRSMQFALRYEF